MDPMTPVVKKSGMEHMVHHLVLVIALFSVSATLFFSGLVLGARM